MGRPTVHDSTEYTVTRLELNHKVKQVFAEAWFHENWS